MATPWSLFVIAIGPWCARMPLEYIQLVQGRQSVGWVDKTMAPERAARLDTDRKA